MRLLPREMRRRELSLERARRQREGDLCWGQALPPAGCGKVRSGVGRAAGGWGRLGFQAAQHLGEELSRDRISPCCAGHVLGCKSAAVLC